MLHALELENFKASRADNGFVDLGSFKEMLFDHDPKRTLSICVEITLKIR